MTVVFKTLRADIHHFISAMGQSESFRTTGDCSDHNYSAPRTEA